MSRRLILLALTGLLSGSFLHAQDLGTSGRTFEIRERDGIEAMKDEVAKKLANGGQERMIKEAYDRHIAVLNNVPTPPGVSRVVNPETRIVDITYVVDETLRDEDGNIIVLKGTRINPLQIRPLTKRIFFIDASNKRHLDYVKKNAAFNDRIIALAGSVLKAGEYLDRHVYMDIVGLSHSMKVKAFPAVVSQVGTQLKIEELRL